MDKADFRDQLVDRARASGIDLVGITPVARLNGAPAGHRPIDLLPAAKSVIVLAKHLPREVLNNRSQLTVKTTAATIVMAALDEAAFSLALFLEEKGGRALPIPADDPYTAWNAATKRGAGELSHKHAAVAAGLGWMGRNTLLVTPQFGNRVYLVSVLTDLAIEPGQSGGAAQCPPACRRCLEACPVGAIRDDGLVDQLLCRSASTAKLPRGFTVSSCWECRRACPYGC